MKNKKFLATVTIALGVIFLISAVLRDDSLSVNWSATGDWIVFSCGSVMPHRSDLYLIRPDGSEFQQLTKNIVADFPNWSPSGDWIVFSADKAIYKVRPNGSDRQRIIDLSGEGIYGDQILFADWSPDGEWILFSRGFDDHSIYRMRPDGNNLQALVEDIQVLGGLSWSPDGALLAISNSRSQDDLSEGLVFMNPDGTNLETVVANNRLNGRAAWSPDSKQIAYIQNTNHGRVIVILDLMTNDSYHIPLNFSVSSVAWSPDGEWIAFSTDNELYKVRLDGSNQIQLVVVDDCIIGYSGISWFSFN